MDSYSFFDVLLWSGMGFFIGELTTGHIIGLNRNQNLNHMARIAMTYRVIGFVAGSVKAYTGKSIIELITKP